MFDCMCPHADKTKTVITLKDGWGSVHISEDPETVNDLMAHCKREGVVGMVLTPAYIASVPLCKIESVEAATEDVKDRASHQFADWRLSELKST